MPFQYKIVEVNNSLLNETELNDIGSQGFKLVTIKENGKRTSDTANWTYVSTNVYIFVKETV